MTDKIDELLKTKRETHGNAHETFEIGMDLISIIVNNTEPLRPHHFAIINILHKIARITCGSYHEDHWDDIEGYARLGKQIHSVDIDFEEGYVK